MHRTRLAVAPSDISLLAAVARVQGQPRWLRPTGPEALVELRLDRMADADGPSLARAVHQLGAQRVIVTYRGVAEGGGLDGRALHDDAQRDALVACARALGAAFIDVELACVAAQEGLRRALLSPVPKGPAGSQTAWVASVHAQGPMPPVAQMDAQAREAKALGARVFKMVVTSQDPHDQAAFAAFAHGPQPLPTLAILTGNEGLFCRLLVGRQTNPGPYTLVRLDDDPGLAPGQPSWSEADAQYRVWQVGPNTQVFGVVGSPIAHSRSPALHAQAIDACGLDAIYLPFEVPGPLSTWLAGVAQALQVRGLSVTAPHKVAALGAATGLSPAALAVGAANTLYRPDPSDRAWHGVNTDGAAAAASLAAWLPHGVRGTKILLLGAGGAARAVAWELALAGAQVHVWARRAGAAEALALDLAQRLPKGHGVTAVGDLDEGALLGACAAVVHCTPVGMAGTGTWQTKSLLSEAQLAQLPRDGVVFDTVYAPPVTPLLHAAHQRGLKTLGGADMLARQAQGQMALFYKHLAGTPEATDLGVAQTTRS